MVAGLVDWRLLLIGLSCSASNSEGSANNWLTLAVRTPRQTAAARPFSRPSRSRGGPILQPVVDVGPSPHDSLQPLFSVVGVICSSLGTAGCLAGVLLWRSACRWLLSVMSGCGCERYEPGGPRQCCGFPSGTCQLGLVPPAMAFLRRRRPQTCRCGDCSAVRRRLRRVGSLRPGGTP